MTTNADQICYSVLCVFSYVAAGTDKSALPHQRQIHPPSSLQPSHKKTLTQLPIAPACLMPGSPPGGATATPRLDVIATPSASSEPGSVTPVGGPPKYPPPALPPGVAPPAPPPGVLKTLPTQMSLPVSSRPPPVPSRTIPPRQMTVAGPPSSAPPQPPPRPK